MKKAPLLITLTCALLVTGCTPSGPSDAVSPSIQLEANRTDFTQAGELQLTATATDQGSGIARVEFKKDGQVVHTDSTAPYQHTEAFSAATGNGTHTYTALAVDRAGNRKESAPPLQVTVNIPAGDTTPPTVSLTASQTQFVQPGPLVLRANAADNVGISRVEFFEGQTRIATDETAPYEHTWYFTDADNRIHLLTAKAYDLAGNVTTSGPALAVSVNLPPADPLKAAEQAFQDLDRFQAVPTQLDAQTQATLRVLGLDVSKLFTALQPQQALHQQGVGLGLQAAEVLGQLMPQATLSLPTGTYTEDASGAHQLAQFGNRRFTKTSAAPAQGVVVLYQEGGQNRQYHATYHKTVLTGNNPVTEVLVAGKLQVTTANTVLGELSFDTNGAACASGGVAFTQGTAALKVGTAIDFAGQFAATAGQHLASTQFRVVTSQATVSGKARFEGAFSAPIPGVSSCVNGPYSVLLQNALLNVDLQVNNTRANLSLQASNLKNVEVFSSAGLDLNNARWEGDIAGRVLVQVPGAYGNLLTVSGNLKDGPADADTLPGDQAPVLLYIANNLGLLEVNSTVQKLIYSRP